MLGSVFVMAPLYLSELCEHTNNSVRTRSSAFGDFKIQKTRTEFGERAFAVAGPSASNSLPFNIRNSANLNSFKAALRTFMFSQLDP